MLNLYYNIYLLQGMGRSFLYHTFSLFNITTTIPQKYYIFMILTPSKYTNQLFVKMWKTTSKFIS